MDSRTLIGKTLRTVYGDWVKVYDAWDNVLTTSHGYVHISKVQLSTAY